MSQKNTRYLEKCILENTDRLIESAIAASLLEDDAKEKEFRRGTELIREIARNLRDLIDVKDEYLPEILNQIISQKLPDTKVQKSLGTFTMELDRMLQLGLKAMGSNIEFTPISEANLDSEFKRDSQGTDVSHTIEDNQEGNIEIVEAVPPVETTFTECEEPLTGPCLIEDVEFMPIPESTPVEEFLAVEAMTLVAIDESPNEPNELNELNEPNESIATSTVTLSMEKDSVDGILNSFENPEAEQTQSVDQCETTLDPEAVVVFQSKVKDYPFRNLEFSLRLIFPGVEILRDVTFDGISFGYYIPSKWVVFDEDISPEDRELKTKICQQEGIMYLIIDPEDGKNPRRVERIIQRHKINTRG